MKRILAALAGVLLLVGLGAVTPTAASAAPGCDVSWGSLTKARSGSSAAHLTDLRTGEHACFDRLVVDLDHRATGYTVRYVTAVHRPGSGQVVPLAGAADLEIVVRAPAYDAAGRATLPLSRWSRAADVTGYDTFRQVTVAGSFEGETTIGLGVRARLPMRVLVLDGPGTGSRVFVDVAHRW